MFYSVLVVFIQTCVLIHCLLLLSLAILPIQPTDPNLLGTYQLVVEVFPSRDKVRNTKRTIYPARLGIYYLLP
ncbi:hypothetical protein GGS21DRAFT_312785 [Xylaria nigripes]|nr:hypothetical protein GGS21DRAFT_312785 [Xylaria nigripes]